MSFETMDFLIGLYDRPETQGTAKASPEAAESSASPAPPEPGGEPSGGPVVIRAEVVGDGLHLPWPEALADWAMLLTPDDLPERFHLRQGVEVVDSAKFLTSLRRDIRRGPSGPRARYGALQRDLANLHSALLGGQTTARRNRPPRTARLATEAADPTRNTLGTSGDFGAVCGLSQGCGNR